ncbi:DAK2 domain-containing protein [Schaalia dentiphila]|uniref:DAK2 domain-containing protein n=1 Tax=Schaalia dentiphila TaxID=3050224 RepID=UPI002852C45D|nr:DAK2 domain-containing protein [Schaalia sp. C24]
MDLNASVIIEACRAGAEEAARLAPFLDDLDGWDGADCDTGSNGAATMAALEAAMDSLDPRAHLRDALEAAVETIIRRGLGHSGMALGALFEAWAGALGDEHHVTPVVLRRMIAASLSPVASSIEWSDALAEMLGGAVREIQDLGATLPEVEDVFSRFSSQAQIGLVEATNEATGRIDPGGAFVALVLACIDASMRGDAGILQSFTAMLADLAERHSRAPEAAPPPPGRDFTVDIILEGTQEDLDALLARLGGLGARLSYVGRVDLFGMGEWRLHVDTSAPLAAHPTSGQVIRFQVCDARPDAQIGIDELADEGLSHRGVRLLQRRPMRRVERARVIACTSAPGLVEDLARAGAVVFLDPSSGDAAGIVSAATSRTGVTLVATCDEASASLVGTVASVLPAPAPGVPAILRAGSRDDLDVLAVARACAPLFVPQPGGVEAAPTLARMLRDGAHDALASCASAPLPPGGDPEGIAEALAEASRSGGNSWRLLISRDDDGPYTVATVRQLLSTRDASSTIDLETWDGGQSGPSLVAGCAS